MSSVSQAVAVPSGQALTDAYLAVREGTDRLCAPLGAEDYVVQSMPDASPAKWHLAHTTWFFETFLLIPELGDYRPFHADFSYLFNSYYNALGDRLPRAQRGLLTRPTVAEVYRYRKYVDEQMRTLLCRADVRAARLAPLLELGLNHEQQHQELLLTDLLHAFSMNPLRPAYRILPAAGSPISTSVTIPCRWLDHAEGIWSIGQDGSGFAFDNETPRHRVFLAAFRLASRLATTDEYLAFMADKGYERPELWLSDGWAARQEHGWDAPLYWEQVDDCWERFGPDGLRPLVAAAPVSHVSFYEADAFARWAGARLPTEQEWETAAMHVPVAGNFLDEGRLMPMPGRADAASEMPAQMFGDVWEWTGSAYSPYPGYRPAAGALGEYNGKFMCNQFVLRGGSCFTPRSHIRATYRNFFGPETRWQMAGIRLARDA